VLGVEPYGLLASTVRRQHREVPQQAAELVLADLVVLRPDVGVLEGELHWLGQAKPVRK